MRREVKIPKLNLPNRTQLKRFSVPDKSLQVPCQLGMHKKSQSSIISRSSLNELPKIRQNPLQNEKLMNIYKEGRNKDKRMSGESNYDSKVQLRSVYKFSKAVLEKKKCNPASLDDIQLDGTQEFNLLRKFTKMLRAFCSFDKEQILELGLVHAQAHGFTERALINACNDLQISSSAHTIVKPIELIYFSMRKWNRKTFEEVPQDFKDYKKTAQIKWLIKSRLSKQIPYSKWNEAMALGAHPQNAGSTAQILWQFADDCWYLAGDNSTDYNYYSKRSLFLYIYGTTELHLITDQSPQQHETWDFMQRRFEDSAKIGQTAEFTRQLGSTISTSAYYLMRMFR